MHKTQIIDLSQPDLIPKSSLPFLQFDSASSVCTLIPSLMIWYWLLRFDLVVTLSQYFYIQVDTITLPCYYSISDASIWLPCNLQLSWFSLIDHFTPSPSTLTLMLPRHLLIWCPPLIFYINTSMKSVMLIHLYQIQLWCFSLTFNLNT